MDYDVLILSGLWNSGPQHWQSHWEARHPAWRRVQHRDWNAPRQEEWVAELDAVVATCSGAPVLVGHSLGCMLAVQWAQSGSPLRAAGAFPVAPSDVEAASYPIDANGFTPIPMARLPFPSIVVASTNDEYVTRERARAFADAWGSRYLEIGDAGHVNADSGYGDWPEGERMLQDFLAQLRG
ncbi:alpha/beta hydrolase [Massilia sp. Dwa41.01b]|uniref:RBBP9/YdeN family alpha/beta hydrolase n=1 Tax=Massilia sp. Dwa41.01b TaxID=2709302 RepID=UPI0015FFCC61|nr:alpha/beta hydrolase [Massilia sp. Dwa41.01b]QNA89613.1 alpha/beta hydrolase [Massilia sp. Dwa41.01b]